MTKFRCTLFAAAALSVCSAAWGQASLSAINKQLKNLMPPSAPMDPSAPPDSSKGSIPDAQRPAVILQLAKDIRALPAGNPKVKAADMLDHVATEGEAGTEALQATADTLAQALTETPQPAEKDGQPAMAYFDLAKLVRYEGIKTSLSDPMLAKANQLVLANEADVAKADFTLKDVSGKKVTLSALRSKIVLINFWSSACMLCQKEMQDIDLIYTHYQPQGLEVLSITGDNPFRAASFLAGKNYHPTVLFDIDGKVGKAYHVDELRDEGLPRAFVYDRDGKLVAMSIDTSTQRQLFSMLSAAGLQPSR